MEATGMMPEGSMVPYYFGPYPNYATSQLPIVERDPVTGDVTSVMGGIRKFVDSLPGLGPENANTLGQYIPVAVPDKVTYPGSDYYEIALVEFREQMHPDLPIATKLRGYVQVQTSEVIGAGVLLYYLSGLPIFFNGTTTQVTAVDDPHYMGPFIIAQKDVPVRVKFYNFLPTGMEGNLFIPVDTTVMGSGMGPIQATDEWGGLLFEADGVTPMMESYTQNRATLHLHGGRTPWISDGTPHQWITPAGEDTVYPEGVSVYNVPDMADPGDGAQTFYYTNQQSARLMFYHDHSFGITRLNVYAGEAAGYLLEDDIEKALVSSGIIPSTQIPLIIQDKTFVPDNMMPYMSNGVEYPSQLGFQDPTWNATLWGGVGELWYPHVYMPMENPYDPSGMSMFGRWMYAPYFWPPAEIQYPPVPNPYYDPMMPMDPMNPPMIPGLPNPSIPGESFMDTPVVNGALYPYLDVDPSTYRFRILNAANDRYWNLQMYVADETVTTYDGRNNTEVKMVPAVPTVGWPEGWPTDGRPGGVPDPATVGPDFIQIGTEGGFLPSPVVIGQQPVGWNTDAGTFDVGLVNAYSLYMGPAERADVIIDFSQYAGKTLILYNDAPAPVPANDPRLDYYTDDPDQEDIGGAPSTVAGFGPNTRTIMQIRVANITPAQPFNLDALMAAFITNDTQTGVFQASQHDVIVPQAAYNDAYGANFPDLWANIQARNLTFTPIGSDTPVTIPFQFKAIHDEMGETYDEYGRMRTSFGVELPRTSALQATTILYGFADAPTEVVGASISGTQIGTLDDGTQLWNIVHNGVDTHVVHWHMFEVQLISRTAWDNNVRWPDANELGWKETLKVNPLQNTLVALRPILPDIPFDIPNSIRLIEPTMPEGAILKTVNIADPAGQPITMVNHYVNYGWEYIWHCHMLTHEENDMMRTIAVAAVPRAPSGLSVLTTGSSVSLEWVDNSLDETQFIIQRADDANFTVGLVEFSVGMDVTTYVDNSVKAIQNYYYRVLASNVVGDTWDYSLGGAIPSVGFPTIEKRSDPSVAAMVPISEAYSIMINATTPFDAVATAGMMIGMTGTGSANITLQYFTGNPVGTDPTNAGGYYRDVLLLNTTGEVLSIWVRFYYDPATFPPGFNEANIVPYFWNGANWIAPSDFTINTVENYAQINIRADTVPSFADLTGTVFGFGTATVLANPVIGHPATLVALTGSGFGATQTFEVFLAGTLIATGTTSAIGEVALNVFVPFVPEGIYDLYIVDATGIFGSTQFTVLGNTPIEVTMDVGDTHFPGELVTWYATTTINGVLNDVSLTAMLYGPGGLVSNLTALVTPVSAGLYSVSTTIPAGAAPGEYALVIKASLGGTHFGASLAVMQISDSLLGFQASLSAIYNNTMEIITTLGTIQFDLDAINATVTSINGTVVQIQTDLGVVQATADAINATVTSINGTVALVQTELGVVHVTVDAINATVTTIQGDLVIVNTTLGVIQVTLADIQANLTAIDGVLATMTTTLGEIQLSLADIEARIVVLNGTVAEIWTTVGSIEVTLDEVNATVTSIEDGVATITTTLGTISGNVIEIRDGVATIETEVGEVQLQVGDLAEDTKANANGAMIGFILLGVGLVVIILVVLMRTKKN
ncbi:MAG: hypothetical protein AB9819_08050 [Methanomassiliicoccales archaeon]